jgi:hypothetical protein
MFVNLPATRVTLGGAIASLRSLQLLDMNHQERTSLMLALWKLYSKYCDIVILDRGAKEPMYDSETHCVH